MAPLKWVLKEKEVIAPVVFVGIFGGLSGIYLGTSRLCTKGFKLPPNSLRLFVYVRRYSLFNFGM